MKILVLSNLYPPYYVGGYEKLCFEVTERLRKLGHDTYILTSNYRMKGHNPKETRVSRKLFLFANRNNIYSPIFLEETKRKNQSLRNSEILKKTCANLKPNVIFIWNLYFLDNKFLETIESLNVPAVFLLSDNWLVTQINPAFTTNYFSKNITFLKSHLVLNCAKKIINFFKKSKSDFRKVSGVAIFPSKFMQEFYKEAKFKFEGGNIICHHGVIPLNQNHVLIPNRIKLLGDSNVKLLFAGRVVEIKGLHIVLESIKKLNENFKDKRFLLEIVGDIKDQEYLRKINIMIKTLQIKEFINLRGPVKECDLLSLFNSHDIYLFPSLYEPFSLTLIHALQSGIPTIASSVGGNLEIVKHKKNGLLFNPHDPKDLINKIIMMTNSNKLRSNISKLSIASTKALTVTNMTKKIETILMKVAK
jgi:glycosyltransferase involved in cell wall biosynthesis